MAKQQYQKKVGNNDLISFLSEERGMAPPQAIELEEAIIGAILIEKDAIHDVIDILKPDSFYSDKHQVIFGAIMELSSKLEPIDLYTVGNFLNARGKLTEVGGAGYLADLTEKVGSAAHVVSYAKIVAQKYIQRELIRAATEIQRTSFDGSRDVDDLIDLAEGEIFKVSEGHIKKDVRKAYDIVAEALSNIEAAGKNTGGLNGVPTGFTDLDNVTLGWQPSDLIILAARPSMGKTAFVLSMARNSAIDFKQSVAVFSLEMNDVQLISRLIISESGLDSHKIKNGDLTPIEWEHLQKSVVSLSDSPLMIDDTPALSIFEFRSKARRLKAQYDIKLIIIDYLQLMTGPPETRGQREQEVSAISRSLKSIARELKVPIIALSQLNRSVETRGGNKRPQLSDLRESGAIEQDADIVAFIHRPEYYGIKTDDDGTELEPGTAEIIIAKHRNGSLANVRLKFVGERAQFVNMHDVPSAASLGGRSAFITQGLSGNKTSVQTEDFEIESNFGNVFSDEQDSSPF